MFVLTDDEVELLLKATIKYKKLYVEKKIGWESRQKKYTIILTCILDLFVAQYPSPEQMISTIALHVLLESLHTFSRFI